MEPHSRGGVGRATRGLAPALVLGWGGGSGGVGRWEWGVGRDRAVLGAGGGWRRGTAGMA